MVKAAVRVALTSDSLDDYFGLRLLTGAARREVRELLVEAPAEASVVVDLGPSRHVDDELIRDLSLMRCAPGIVFEARRWDVAITAAQMLSGILDRAAAPS